MIPASYFYKDVLTDKWGDPRNPHGEPIASEPQGPRDGHFFGLSTLLTLALSVARPRRANRLRLAPLHH